jgi:hypothetical protein
MISSRIMARPDDRSLLEAALVGYTSQLSTITTAIADIHKRLGKKGPGAIPAPVERTAPRKKRQMSPEGRARIAAAQRKRWAAAKKRG